MKVHHNTTHGMSHTPTYASWHGMKTRVLNPNSTGYKYWGGRGLTIHKPWLDFKNFVADMGLRPEGTSLERIDNNKGYSPENCRWATPKEQFFNRGGTKVSKQDVARIRKLYRENGITQKELGERYKMDQSQISRIVNGKAW